jgi:hypothetical protein
MDELGGRPMSKLGGRLVGGVGVVRRLVLLQ